MDFSAVLSARELQDRFSILSTFRTIGDGGREVSKHEHHRHARGVVIPGKMSLNRLADGSRVNAFVDVFTRETLTVERKVNDRESQDADIIEWNGNTYTVMSVEDYSRFGAGFFKASCDLQTLSSPARSREHR